MIHPKTTVDLFSMDRTERFYKIEHLIRSRGCVSFAVLLEALEVSPATLKRDLAYLRERLDALLGPGQGHDAVYLYLGIQKVVQAAGRVLRSVDDRGWVWLLDSRYRRPDVRALLPAWWRL